MIFEVSALLRGYSHVTQGKMMKIARGILNKSAGILVLLTLISTAQAAESGFYVEADVGRSSVSDSGASIDENATGFRLATGYQFIPWLAVDVGYVSFGSFDSVIDLQGMPVAVDISADGLELGLVGRIPLGEKFALTARVEKIWWDAEFKAAGIVDEDSGNEFAYGVGAEIAIGEKFALTGAWQKYDLAGTDVDLLYFGLRLRF